MATSTWSGRPAQRRSQFRQLTSPLQRATSVSAPTPDGSREIGRPQVVRQPPSKERMVGVFHRTSKGFGFVRPEKPSLPSPSGRRPLARCPGVRAIQSSRLLPLKRPRVRAIRPGPTTSTFPSSGQPMPPPATWSWCNCITAGPANADHAARSLRCSIAKPTSSSAPISSQAARPMSRLTARCFRSRSSSATPAPRGAGR